MIEAPIVAVTSNGLGLAGKSGGTEVALANGAQAVHAPAGAHAWGGSARRTGDAHLPARARRSRCNGS